MGKGQRWGQSSGVRWCVGSAVRAGGLILLLLSLVRCAMAEPSSPPQLIPLAILRESGAASTATYTPVPTFTSTPIATPVPSPWSLSALQALSAVTPLPMSTFTQTPADAWMLPPGPTPASLALPTGTSTPTLEPTATLTFDEMSQRYGPCASVPVLMYHHVQSYQQALAEGNEPFTITTERFRQQMTYLVDRGYTAVRMQDLDAFFDEGLGLPPKPVLLTFDDGYDDFASDVVPILVELGLHATVFLPTGLIGQPGHLTWGQIGQIASHSAGAGGVEILFANHTVSHTNVGLGREAAAKEISAADAVLSERGLNRPRTFCYPYGVVSGYAQEILADVGYGLAFTTEPGSVLCKGRRLVLPRTRVGAVSLEAYGF